MLKTVKSGERCAKITLDGTECMVKFSSGYNVVSVRAENDVLIYLESGKTADDDGVMLCKGGSSVMYPHMRKKDTVYLMGTGVAEVVVSNEAVNPFKADGEGGENSGFVFSTDEQAAGTWIDGRTIYKKTIQFTAFNQSTSQTSTTAYEHNIENVDIIWFSGDSFWITNGVQKVLGFQTGISPELVLINTHCFNCSVSATKINITTGPALGDVVVYATVMYVKK